MTTPWKSESIHPDGTERQRQYVKKPKQSELLATEHEEIAEQRKQLKADFYRREAERERKRNAK